MQDHYVLISVMLLSAIIIFVPMYFVGKIRRDKE